MPYLSLLRRKPVLVLWSANALSVLGDRFFALAVMWIALERSGPVAMGAVAIAESVPYVLMGTFGRRIVARCASFRVLAGFDVVRAGLAAALPVVWNVGGTPAMLVMVLTLGIAGSVFDPGFGSLVPELVAPEERQAILGAMDITGRIARIAGPGLAGLLLLVAPASVLFAADAVTFAVSAVALLVAARIAAVSAVVSSGPAPDRGVDPASARVLLRANPSLGAAWLVHGVGFFLSAIPAIGMPVLLAHHLHVDASAYGLVLAASGVGALLGNLVAARVRLTAGFPGWFCGAWAISGGLLIATGAASSLGWIVAFAVASGAVSPFISIAMAARLAMFPADQRLRLNSLNFTVMRASGTLGMAVIPALIAAGPARGFVLGGSVLAVVAAAVGVFGSSLGAVRGQTARVVEAVDAASTTPGPDQAASTR
ncbi:MFS transporter [Nocardia sp. NBC_01499]|uniref:MFS transporter n=1 Tax=Nocardia sp. NBC_01499 TaxID=2903597 RepID=UPI00386DD474